MEKKMIRDESLLEVNGRSWTIETLTPEERQEYYKISADLTDNWNYVAYNDFIRRMNEKYGERYSPAVLSGPLFHEKTNLP